MVLTLEKEAVHPREAKLRRVQVAYARANATDIWPPDAQSRRQIQICVVLRSRGKARVPAHQPGVSHIINFVDHICDNSALVAPPGKTVRAVGILRDGCDVEGARV